MSIETRFIGLLFAMFLIGSSVFAQGEKADCRKTSAFFQKNVCSGIENNKAYHIKNLMERKSGENSLEGILFWTKFNYECFRCNEEPGFKGGSVLRKVVFENALSVAFFFVYDARVDMNFVERDGKTLVDWLRDDTEKTFDAAFEVENGTDKMYLIKQIQINQKYYNIFKNNGAKFRYELIQGGSKF